LFDTHTARNLIMATTSVQVVPGLEVSGGGRYEHEDGYTQSGGASAPRSQSTRDNGGAFIEGRATYQRLFVSGGAGFEHNAVFGNAEILLPQTRDELPVFGGDHHIDVHQRHVYLKRIVR